MNAVLAATVLREAFYLRNLAGLFLTVVGSVVVVTNAPPPYEEMTAESFLRRVSDTPSLAYTSLIVAAVSALCLVEPRYGERCELRRPPASEDCGEGPRQTQHARPRPQTC